MHILFLMMLFFSMPTFAQDASPQIRVDTAACRYVTKHIPNADVAYQPNVDVHGKKVVPADLNPSSVDTKQLEDSVYLRLTNDTAKVFGLNLPEVAVRNPNGRVTREPLVSPETVIGYVTLKNGQVYLDGKPLQPAAQSQLAVLCKHQ